MILNNRILDLLCEQINAELQASYLYLQMMTWMKEKKWDGFANFFKKQSQDENEHANKFIDYVIDRQGNVYFKNIEKGIREWINLNEIFQEYLITEQNVSDKIYNLKSIAMEEDDMATSSFLKWFLDEQVESEATANDILQKLERANDNIAALEMLDDKLGEM